MLDAHIAHQRRVRRRTFDELVVDDVAARVALVGTAKIARWPTRLGKKLHLAGDDLALRELAERNERDRWTKEIRDIVRAAKLPVAVRSSEDAMLLRVAKGRRPNTLRKHVKTWQKAARWFEATYGVAWPRHPEQFAEFLEAMVQEPCARSFPESVFKTLMFLEHAAKFLRVSSYAVRRQLRTHWKRLDRGCNRWRSLYRNRHCSFQWQW